MKNGIASVVIAVAVIIGVWIAGNAYKYKFKSSETISVTGLAEIDFSSDLIVWTGSFNRYGMELKSVYASLKADETAIKNYLNAKGLPDSAIVFSSVTTMKNYQHRYDEKGNEISSEFTGYTLTGKVRVESKNIQLVEKLSREITGLLEQGIELSSEAPEYFYTRLNELKIDLLAKAAVDAKSRAETIAKNSGGSLGGIKKATMGVFQITGKNANEIYSYGGAFNTSSKEKTASITLKVDYLAE
jgi:hypothetical protein